MNNRDVLLVVILVSMLFFPYQVQSYVIDTSKYKNNILLGCYVNINSASMEDIIQLPGIGSTKAQGVIDGRPYQQERDILRVKGIGVKTLSKIEPYIRIKEVPCDFTI